MKRRLHRYLVGISVACIGFVASLSARGQSVTIIEPTPGNTSTTAEGLSGDGTSVLTSIIGNQINEERGFNSPPEFRWSKQAGFVEIPILPGKTESSAAALSSNGSVIVGQCYGASNPQPFLWSASTGIIGLGNKGQAADVSADGSVVVGYNDDYAERRAFRWTQASGLVSLGTLPDCPFSEATAVSADGSVVVGTCFSSDLDAEIPFRWTAQTGMVPLETPARDASVVPTIISADGTVVAGEPFQPFGTWQWSLDKGFTTLTGDFLTVNSMNHDGSIVVGVASAPFIWDPIHGTRDLQDVLFNDYGLADSFNGMTLVGSVYVSDDGLTFAGKATTPLGDLRGWIATVPEPGSLGILAAGIMGLMGRRRAGSDTRQI